MSEITLVMNKEDWEEYHWLLCLDNEEQLKEIRRLLANPNTDWDTISWLTDLQDSIEDSTLP